MGRLLWQPSKERIERSNMYQFMQHVNERFGKSFSTYDELYRWSVSEIPDFWQALWDYGEVIHSAPKLRGS